MTARARAAADRAQCVARVHGAVRTCTLIYWPGTRSARRKGGGKAVVLVGGRHYRVNPDDVIQVLGGGG